MSSQPFSNNGDKFIQVTSILALRKTEFFDRMWVKLKPGVPPELEEHKKRQELLRVVSNMPNTAFLSDIEKGTKTIDPKLDISHLRLDERGISKEFYNTLTTTKYLSAGHRLEHFIIRFSYSILLIQYADG